MSRGYKLVQSFVFEFSDEENSQQRIMKTVDVNLEIELLTHVFVTIPRCQSGKIVSMSIGPKSISNCKGGIPFEYVRQCGGELEIKPVVVLSAWDVVFTVTIELDEPQRGRIEFFLLDKTKSITFR